MLGLKRQVFGEIRSKGVGGAAASGSMLLGLADAYVGAINAGALPTISTAWQSVLTIECQKALDGAAALFRTKAREAAAAEPVSEGQEESTVSE